MINLILAGIFILVEIGMTFLSMFLLSVTFMEDYAVGDMMFQPGIILVSLVFWSFIVPVCSSIWVIRLIAYPFRKKWR